MVGNPAKYHYMDLHQRIHTQLLSSLQQNPASEASLNDALRLLAKYRSTLLQGTIVQQHGTKVMGGIFAGMDFVAHSAEGCHVPKLLGCYEEELQPFLSRISPDEYSTVLSIGCAEGYYAVGIKRLLPNIRVLAYDTNPLAQAACQSLATKNHVEIEIGGLFKPEDFANFSGLGKTLLWCDIEGAERELLDPKVSPALAQMDLVVEFHPTPQGHTFNDVLPRFAESHEIEVIHGRGHNPILPPFLEQLGHLDRLLAQWEWRSSPTPWGILRSRQQQ
jgi:hypothetical protein